MKATRTKNKTKLSWDVKINGIEHKEVYLKPLNINPKDSYIFCDNSRRSNNIEYYLLKILQIYKDCGTKTIYSKNEVEVINFFKELTNIDNINNLIPQYCYSKLCDHIRYYKNLENGHIVIYSLNYINEFDESLLSLKKYFGEHVRILDYGSYTSPNAISHSINYIEYHPNNDDVNRDKSGLNLFITNKENYTLIDGIKIIPFDVKETRWTGLYRNRGVPLNRSWINNV